MLGCIICILFGVIIILSLHLLQVNEHFRLSKEKTQYYFFQKQQELAQEYESQAVEHCSPLLRLSLRWSPDESEVSNIETKEFPCGNTVLKCIYQTIEKLKRGDPIRPMPNDILELSNS
jgi:hypothetical protein